MKLNAIGRNYFIATREKFEAIVEGQEPSSTLPEVEKKITEIYGENPSEDIVVVEVTNVLEEYVPPPTPKPQPRKVLVSTRKLGKREKPAAPAANSNAAAEETKSESDPAPETNPVADPTPTVERPSRRRSAAAAAE